MAVNIRSDKVIRYTSTGFLEEPDIIVVEEPLEIRVGYGEENARDQFTVSITMRSPGEDNYLGLGFLYTEGIINAYDEIMSIKHCDDLGKNEVKDNVIRAELATDIIFDQSIFRRNFYTNSSCGICGKASIESVHVTIDERPTLSRKVSSSLISSLPEKLLDTQHVFKHTGGLHASGLFDLSGKLLCLHEDIGRHNALDKLIGELFTKKALPAQDTILVLSGRVSFELVQKALRAGIPVIAAVGAPSSLAIDLAHDYGITLLGFVRKSQFNIYTGEENIEK